MFELTILKKEERKKEKPFLYWKYLKTLCKQKLIIKK